VESFEVMLNSDQDTCGFSAAASASISKMAWCKKIVEEKAISQIFAWIAAAESETHKT